MKKLLFKKERKDESRADYLRDLPSLILGAGVPASTTPFVPLHTSTDASASYAPAFTQSGYVTAFAVDNNFQSSIDPRNCDYAIARYDFKMTGGTFLELQKGDYIAILSRDEEHYLTGRSLETGELGSFPEKYAQLISFADLPPNYQTYMMSNNKDVFSKGPGSYEQSVPRPDSVLLEPIVLLPNTTVASSVHDGFDSRMMTVASTADPNLMLHTTSNAFKVLPIPVSPYWEPASHPNMPTPRVTSSSPIARPTSANFNRSSSPRSPEKSVRSGRMSPISPLPKPISETVSPVRERPSRANSPAGRAASPTRIAASPVRLSPTKIADVVNTNSAQELLQKLKIPSRTATPTHDLSPSYSAKSAKEELTTANSENEPVQHAQSFLSNDATRTRLLSLKQIGSSFANLNKFFEYRNDPSSFLVLDQSMRRLGPIRDESNLTPKLLTVKYLLPCSSNLPTPGKFDSGDTPVMEFPCKQTVDQLRAIFIWVAEQISYSENPGHADTASDVLRTRKSGAEGYANLVDKLCQHINVPCFKITGYVRNSLSDAGNIEMIPSINHAWNVVQLHGMFFVLDTGLASPTHPMNASNFSAAFYKLNKISESGSLRVSRLFSGSLTGMTMSKKGWSTDEWAQAFKPNHAYFLADPEVIIWTHFPLNTTTYQRQLQATEHKLQYVDKPISIQFFLNMPLTLPQNFWDWSKDRPQKPLPYLTILEPAGAFWNHDTSSKDVGSYGVFQAYIDDAYGVWCDVVPRNLFQAQLQDYVKGTIQLASPRGITSKAVIANTARRLLANDHNAVNFLGAKDRYVNSSASQTRCTCLVQFIYDGLKQRRLADIRAYATSRDFVCISVGTRISENALNLNPYKLSMIYAGAPQPEEGSSPQETGFHFQPSQVDAPVNPLTDEFVHAVVTPNEFYIEQPMQYYLALHSRITFSLHDTSFAVNVNKDKRILQLGRDPTAEEFPSPFRVALKINGSHELYEFQAFTQKIEHENPRPEQLNYNGYLSPLSPSTQSPQYYTRVYMSEIELNIPGPATLVYHDGTKWRVIAEYQIVS